MSQRGSVAEFAANEVENLRRRRSMFLAILSVDRITSVTVGVTTVGEIVFVFTSLGALLFAVDVSVGHV